MLKGFKYRLYPNKEQKVLLDKHFGCSRFVYNWGLERKIEEWSKNHKSLSKFDLINELTLLKKLEDKEWLYETNAQTLQQALDNLDKAYVRFFREKKGFPKFKNKKNNKQSFNVPQHIRIDFSKYRVYFPKFKEGIKIAKDRKFEGKVKNITISKTSTNKYFVSVLVDIKQEPLEKQEINEQTTIGLDLGIKTFVTLSNGEKFENPRILRKYERKLKREQRRLSRKQKGSKNRNKQRIKAARVYEKITNTRNDFLHKLSYRLTHDNQVKTIIVEDLNVSGMMKNHKLAKEIGNCSWSRFIELLKYKAEWYGINLLKIGRFEPSSKVCSVCGVIKEDLMLKDRTWTCLDCGTNHDRDINAAINIKHFGLHNSNYIGWDTPKSTLGEITGRKRGRRTKKLRKK